MKITDQKDIGLRFWGCEPLSATVLHNGANTLAQRTAARAQLKAEREAIKAAGLKCGMGLKARIAAVGMASKIEKATGVEMHVFNHDYLF